MSVSRSAAWSQCWSRGRRGGWVPSRGASTLGLETSVAALTGLCHLCMHKGSIEHSPSTLAPCYVPAKPRTGQARHTVRVWLCIHICVCVCTRAHRHAHTVCTRIHRRTGRLAGARTHRVNITIIAYIVRHGSTVKIATQCLVSLLEMH